MARRGSELQRRFYPPPCTGLQIPLRFAPRDDRNARHDVVPDRVPAFAGMTKSYAAPASISSSAFSSTGGSVSMNELTENSAFPAPGGP